MAVINEITLYRVPKSIGYITHEILKTLEINIYLDFP